MRDFLEALASKGKNPAIPDECDYFGKLVGSWHIDYVDNNESCTMEGEWHFAWILEGMAIQDVIILPGYEYGTSLRVYNPETRAWDVAYGYTGEIIRLEARGQDGGIVLTRVDDERRKWVFVSIEDDRFHWQNVTVRDDGEWHVNVDMYAKRIG